MSAPHTPYQVDDPHDNNAQRIEQSAADLGALIAEHLEQPKPWWQSRTLIGVLVALLAQLGRLAGWDVDSAALAQAVIEGLTLAGLALAWWGRVKATRPIERRVLPRRAAADNAGAQRMPEPDGQAPDQRLPPEPGRAASADRGRRESRQPGPFGY